MWLLLLLMWPLVPGTVAHGAEWTLRAVDGNWDGSAGAVPEGSAAAARGAEAGEATEAAEQCALEDLDMCGTVACCLACVSFWLPSFPASVRHVSLRWPDRGVAVAPPRRVFLDCADVRGGVARNRRCTGRSLPTAFVFGNEYAGISDEVRQLAGIPLRLPNPLAQCTEHAVCSTVVLLLPGRAHAGGRRLCPWRTLASKSRRLALSSP